MGLHDPFSRGEGDVQDADHEYNEPEDTEAEHPPHSSLVPDTTPRVTRVPERRRHHGNARRDRQVVVRGTSPSYGHRLSHSFKYGASFSANLG